MKDKLSVGKLPPKLDKLVSNLIRLDRKRQKSEMLKRVPSVKEIMLEIPVTFDTAELIFGFIKKKLKEE